MVNIMYNDSVHNSGWFVIWALARCLRIIHSADNSKGSRKTSLMACLLPPGAGPPFPPLYKCPIAALI